MKADFIIFWGVFAAIFAAVFAAGAVIPRAAYADGVSDCAVPAADVAAIQAIQTNPNLSYADELAQELAARKQALSETISCAQNEAQSLQIALNNVSSTDDTAVNINNRLSGKISDALNYYNLEASQLNNAGINGTEVIARNILAWRTANYDPLVANVNNFILWSANQNLFQTAESRLGKTQQIVAFIESATQDNDLQASLNAAQSSLEAAQSQNQDAETALSQFLPPDQSIILIKTSLQSLADTYTKFSALNALIQTLLPTQ